MRPLPVAQGALVVAVVLSLSSTCGAASECRPDDPQSYACVDTIHDGSRLRLAQQQPTFNAVDSVLQIRRDYLQGPMGRNDAAASGLGPMPSRAGKRPVSTRHPASSRAQLLFPKKRTSSGARWLAGSNRQQSYPSREIPTSCLSLRAGSEPARFRNLLSGWCGIAVWRSPPSL